MCGSILFACFKLMNHDLPHGAPYHWFSHFILLNLFQDAATANLYWCLVAEYLSGPSCNKYKSECHIGILDSVMISSTYAHLVFTGFL